MKTFFIFWCLLITTVITLSTHIHNHPLAAYDDQVWLYLTGADIGYSQKSKEIVNTVIQSMQNYKAMDIRIRKFELRREYTQNYFLPSLIYRSTAEVLKKWFFPNFRNEYPTYLSRAITIGFWIAFLLSWTTLLLCLLATKNLRMIMAFTLTITFIALLEWLFFGSQFDGSAELMVNNDGAVKILLGLKTVLHESLDLLINPYPALSIFGETPRNHFLLLSTAVFLLRWVRSYGKSYLLLLTLSFLHQSYTGLLLGFLFATDVFLRPHLLKQPKTAALIITTAILFIWREHLGQTLGITSTKLIIPGIPIIASGFLIYKQRDLRQGISRFWHGSHYLSDLRHVILKKGDVWSDLIVIAILWCATIPPALLINHFVSFEQSKFFWGQIHGRSLVIFRTVLLLATALSMIKNRSQKIKKRPAKTWLVLLSACTLVAAPISWRVLQLSRNQDIPQLEQQMKVMETELGNNLNWREMGRNKTASIYYAIAKTLDTDE